MPTLRNTAVAAVGRSGKRAVPLALAAVTIAVLGGGVADAKTYTVTYDFENPRVGNAAWFADNDPPGDTGAGPWYGSTFAAGDGLRIAPTGNGGATYQNARGSWWFYAPPGSTIKRARVEGLNGRANERQIARAWLANLSPDDPAPRPANVSREIREAGMSPTTWNNASFTLAPRAGQTAGGFGLWLYTSPCGGLEGATCAPVDPDRGAFVSLRKLTTTIDDPSKAVVNIAGLGDGTVWTNSRDVDLRVEAADPQSGIGSIRADVRSADGERQIGLGQWEPDALHTAPRAFATPPLAESRTATRRVTAASSGRMTLTVRVTNGAGSTTTTRGAIRVDREKPTISWPEKVKPGARVVLRDGGAGLAEGSGLRIVGTDAEVRCVTEKPTCTLRVPASVAQGASVEVTAIDGAGNGRVAKRRATSGNAGAPVPPPSATPRGDVTTIRNARVAGPEGEPFNGYALIQWADPGLTGGGDAHDATAPLFEGQVQDGLIPELDVPTETIAYGRGRKDQSLNIVATLQADAGWAALQFDVWELESNAGSTRAGSRPLPATRPFTLRVSRTNATLQGYTEKGRATPRQAPPSPEDTICGKNGAKGDRIWLAYPTKKTLDSSTMRIFEAHVWHDEAFTFDLNHVRSIKVGVAIAGKLGRGVGVSATGQYESSKTVEDGIGSTTRTRNGPFRAWLALDVDVRKFDLYLVDASEFQRYRRVDVEKGSPQQPGPKRRAEMQCPGDPHLTAHSVVQSGGGLSWQSGPAVGHDGRVKDKAGGNVELWDRAPADTGELRVARKVAYTVSRGFSIDGGVGSVSTSQERADEASSVARWKFTEPASQAKSHFFGGTVPGTAMTWPVIYAGQRKK